MIYLMGKNGITSHNGDRIVIKKYLLGGFNSEKYDIVNGDHLPISIAETRYFKPPDFL